MSNRQSLRSDVTEMLKAFCAAIDMPVEEHGEDEGMLLAPFGYGMVQAMTRNHGLTPREMRLLTVGFLQDVFGYDEDQAEEVADILTCAASDPSLHPYHAIIRHGVEGYDQWLREDEEALVQNFEEINALIDSGPHRDSDQLSELISKDQAGKATPEEKDKLTRILYMGTLPMEKLPPDFVSKHHMTVTDVAARIKRIDWFARCGEPCDFDLTMEVEQVKTWPQAVKALKSRAWDDATAEAQNQVTSFLCRNHPNRYHDDWSNLTERFKSKIVMPLTEQVWRPFQKTNKLDNSIVSSTMWCILAALMENAYMDCNHNSFFFLELLTVYEAGHLPCGWRGEWPDGRLIVF